MEKPGGPLSKGYQPVSTERISGDAVVGTPKRTGVLLISLLLLAMLVLCCVPAVAAIIGRLVRLAQDGQNQKFIARFGDDVLTKDDVDRVMRAEPGLTPDQALGKLIDQDLLVMLGRGMHIDVTDEVSDYERQNPEQIEKAKVLYKLTAEQITRDIERTLMAEQAKVELTEAMQVDGPEIATYYTDHKKSYGMPLETVRDSVISEIRKSKVRDYLDFLHFMSIRELRSGYRDAYISSDDQPMDPRTEFCLSVLTVIGTCVIVGLIEWVLRKPQH
jgi:hypothetical protein